MRRRFSLSLLFAAVVLTAAGARADTIILKNGDKIEGKIVKETDADYTIDFKASAGIVDTRTVLKSEVTKVEKETPDELAYQALKTLKPGANSLPLEGYDAAVQRLQTFVTSFPQSARAAEIGQTATAFTEEKARVEGGEIKLEGKWISKEEVQKEGYQINGHAIYAYLQEQARRGDFVGALNTFEQLEKSYPGSSVFPDAVGAARQLVEKIKSTADQTLQTTKFELKERATATQLLSEPQRSQTLAAQKQEQLRLDAAFEAAAKSGVKWPPFQKHEKTLAALSTKAAAELKRLDALQVPKMRQSLKLAEQGRAELAKQNLDAAAEALRQATSLWSVNEIAIRVQKEVTALKAIAAKATPVPVATPVVRATPAVVVVVRATPPPVTIQAPEEPKGFLYTPLGLGTVAAVLLGLAGGYVAYKKKKRSAEEHLG